MLMQDSCSNILLQEIMICFQPNCDGVEKHMSWIVHMHLWGVTFILTFI